MSPDVCRHCSAQLPEAAPACPVCGKARPLRGKGKLGCVALFLVAPFLLVLAIPDAPETEPTAAVEPAAAPARRPVEQVEPAREAEPVAEEPPEWRHPAEGLTGPATEIDGVYSSDGRAEFPGGVLDVDWMTENIPLWAWYRGPTENVFLRSAPGGGLITFIGVTVTATADIDLSQATALVVDGSDATHPPFAECTDHMRRSVQRLVADGLVAESVPEPALFAPLSVAPMRAGEVRSGVLCFRLPPTTRWTLRFSPTGQAVDAVDALVLEM